MIPLNNLETLQAFNELAQLIAVSICQCYGRIGQSLAKIESLATGELEPPYEVFQGVSGLTLYDDVIRMRVPVRETVVEFNAKIGSTDKEAHELIKENLKIRHNKNEYEAKKGRRPEGLMFKAALDRPFINITDPMQDFTTPMRYQDMSREERRRIRTEIPEVKLVHSVMTDMPAELNRTEAPYEIEDLNGADAEEFIQKERGEFFVGINKNNAVDTMGSTIVQNYAVEMNRPVKQMSAKEIYELNNGKRTISHINLRQLNNNKARQILGLYSGSTSGVREMQDRLLRGF